MTVGAEPIESVEQVDDHRERQLARTREGAACRFAGAADIDELHRALVQQLGQLLERQP